MLNQKQKIIAVIAVIIVGIVLIYSYFTSTKEVYHYEEEIVETGKEEITENQDESIVIHVTGAVKNQGIVKVKENARIYDVIEEAGGTIEGADLEKVNLAYLVEDGQKIYIPFETDGTEGVDDGEIIMQEAGQNVLEEKQEQGKGKININTASLEKLQEIPGVGSATAQKIMDYRKENRKI